MDEEPQLSTQQRGDLWMEIQKIVFFKYENQFDNEYGKDYRLKNEVIDTKDNITINDGGALKIKVFDIIFNAFKKAIVNDRLIDLMLDKDIDGNDEEEYEILLKRIVMEACSEEADKKRRINQEKSNARGQEKNRREHAAYNARMRNLELQEIREKREKAAREADAVRAAERAAALKKVERAAALNRWSIKNPPLYNAEGKHDPIISPNILAKRAIYKRGGGRRRTKRGRKQSKRTRRK